MDSLYQHLLSIKRLEDISAATFQDLNVRIDCDVEASQLVPEEGLKSQPPLPWEKDRASGDSGSDRSASTEPCLMSSGSRYPAKDRWDVIFNELLADNDDAFREAARMQPRAGRSRIRLTQSRRFWAGLERLAQYWDTSLDRYFERPVTPGLPPNNEPDSVQADDDNHAAEPAAATTTPMDIDEPTNARSTDESEKQTVTMYTGRRFGTGREMPETARDETIRGFLEMVAWPFGCQVTVPSLPPRLAVKNLLLPVRWSFFAARSPQDRQLARSGVLEGPVLVAQCRPETSFRDPSDVPGSAPGDICDLLREIGAMLLAAQERARQGTNEVKPGQGKWWTTTPRWGEAQNDEALHSEGRAGNVDEPVTSTAGAATAAAAAAAALSMSHRSARPSETKRIRSSRYEHPFLSSRRSGSSTSSRTKPPTSSERWKSLQPGPTLWDKRMRYMQIGKDAASPFDDVRVYLQYLVYYLP